MDPLSSLLDSINQAASLRSPSAQDVLAHASTINAPSELVALQRTTSAQSELATPESAMSTPADNGATDIVDTEVVISIPRGRPTPTMGRSRAILHLEPQPGAQAHPEFQLQGNGHKAQIIVIQILLPGHDTMPVERCAPGRLVSTRWSIPYNSCGSAKLRHRTSCMGIEGRWGTLQLEARHGTLSDLFPDLGESTYENWDLQQGNVLQAFMDQRVRAAPDET